MGDAIVERLDVVVRTNREAGRNVDRTARGLRGQVVDFREPVSNFENQLKEYGVKIVDNRPVFEGSRFGGTSTAVRQAQRIITDVYNKMHEAELRPSAYAVHDLKKYIDDMVDFGTSGGDSLGQAEGILKSFRRGLDQSLDAQFDDYRIANDVYRETIEALNGFQDAAGRRIDFRSPDGASVASQVGQEARKLTSNRNTRVEFRNTLAEIDRVAAKYSPEPFDAKFGDLVSFANEIEKPRVFGSSADTSLGGIMEANIPTSTPGLIDRGATALWNKVRPPPVNAAKLRQLREYIRSFD